MQTFISLLPQIITAIAALGGVVLTLIFTGRREAKRTAQALAFEREKLIAGDRRQVLLRAAVQLDRIGDVLYDGEVASTLYGPDAWDEAVNDRLQELRKMKVEIGLIAPSIEQSVDEAMKAARAVQSAPSKKSVEESLALLSQYQECEATVAAAMRSLLGTGEVAHV